MSGDTYLWIGPQWGEWQSPANWADLTAGLNPAAVAPGSNDSVAFDGSSAQTQFIGGTGDAGALTFNGRNVVIGSLTAGTLTSTGSLEVDSGGTLSAGNATADTVAVVGGILTVSATLTVTQIAATQGGAIQEGAMTLTSPGANVWVDPSSTIEIGTAGGAAAGTLTVDAGATLSQTGSDAGSYSSSLIDGNIRVDGVLTAQDLSLGFYNPHGAFFGLSGSGTVEVAAGGWLTINDFIAAGSLTLQVDDGGYLYLGAVGADATSVALASNATLSLGSVGAGNTVALNGSNDLVQVGTTFAGTISGFGASDILQVGDTVITGVQYAAGVLTLLDGTATVETIAITGNVAGGNFLLAPVGSNEADIVLTVPGTPSAGTAGHAFDWAGGLVGTWQDAANWTDTTTGATPAVIAPGSNDSVTIDSASYLYRVITGSGAAAALTVDGNAALIGSLSVGTLLSAGSLEVAGGGRCLPAPPAWRRSPQRGADRSVSVP